MRQSSPNSGLFETCAVDRGERLASRKTWVNRFRRDMTIKLPSAIKACTGQWLIQSWLSLESRRDINNSLRATFDNPQPQLTITLSLAKFECVLLFKVCEPRQYRSVTIELLLPWRLMPSETVQATSSGSTKRYITQTLATSLSEKPPPSASTERRLRL